VPKKLAAPAAEDNKSGAAAKNPHETVQSKYKLKPRRLSSHLNHRRGNRRDSRVMFEVTVEAGFSSGHYLRNYRGKCENPHGHNYKVFITLQGNDLDEAGLLLDFKLLKQVMRPVVDYLDHQMINDLEPFTTLNPSAENLARYFYDKTKLQLHDMTKGRVTVKDCTLYETDTSFARYYE
jgi:6-pyruvoyltetrahydropterin/6-carboxytetrahydropterin synthase